MTKDTIVRFAPSPTGFLHVGNIRAALFNYLFTKKNKGKYILRIDDTDKLRSKQEYIDEIINDLNWLGIIPDETYNQSQRFHLYEDAINKLKNDGRLYPCYETPEEIDIKRKLQISRKEAPVYDRESLNISIEKKEKFEKEGRKPHWRFKLNDEEIKWNDLIRGPVHFDAMSLSDPVLIREDGTLLYSLASVVDDIDLGITHIVRGEDHVSNTATHVQLFKALGKNPSEILFAHTSLMVDSSGQGFSKRISSLSVGTLKKEGIQKESIKSHLARLGTSLPIEPILDDSILIESFDFSSLSRAPSKFSKEELISINTKILHLISFDTIKDQLPKWVNEDMWNLLSKNIERIEDLNSWEDTFKSDKTFENILTKEEIDTLKKFKEYIFDEEINEETWKKWTDILKEKTGIKGKKLFMTLRKAITGKEHGPEMKIILTKVPIEFIKKRLLTF